MSWGGTLIATIKAHKPAKIRAFVGDDERDIAVPKVMKGKWAARVVATIESIGAWSRVELLDRGGALLATIDNTEAATELQDLTGKGGVPAQVERMLLVVLKAQREALAFRDAEVQGLLRAQGDVVKELTQGMRALSGLYQEQVSAARELATIQAETKALPEGNDTQQLLEALPTIMQVLPLLKQMMGSKVATPSVKPKNGA